ncbi:MAG TPA: undecaprenyl-diphosphatase UppP [Aggregatilineaceae bacterium]|nr:undecaprenyl-diphosphatase UppP [Aggregatilineaceae bacterium]
MELIKALILGIVQGATEFLPISSSGHLVLVPWLLEWEEPPLYFDVMLHMGTLVAVFLYFWRDWLTLALAGLNALKTRSLQDPNARLLLWIVIGSIPAALAGVLLNDFFESRFMDAPMVAVELMITGAILVWAERYTRRQPVVDDDSMHHIGLLNAFIIGIAQAIAILPGISRSGTTISAGMWRGLPRSVSARFSFLLSTPVIFGAGLYEIAKLATSSEPMGDNMLLPMVVGTLASGIVGYLCIWYLIRLLQRRSLYGFAIYCAVFGMLCLLVALLR